MSKEINCPFRINPQTGEWKLVGNTQDCGDEAKKRPSLSVLLALKGLVPLEADCTDNIIATNSHGVIIHRYYQGNSDFVRKIVLPPDSVNPWEYEEVKTAKVFSKERGKFIEKTID